LLGLEQFTEDLDAGAVAKKLTRREHVAPERHPVLDRAIVVCILGEALARNDIERFPLGHLLS